MIHPDGDRKGVIKTIAETGKIVTHLEETFPANKITDPEIFQSLLFYYGMLTIKGTRGDKLRIIKVEVDAHNDVGSQNGI